MQITPVNEEWDFRFSFDPWRPENMEVYCQGQKIAIIGNDGISVIRVTDQWPPKSPAYDLSEAKDIIRPSHLDALRRISRAAKIADYILSQLNPS